ncbi:MAG: hypothetical protein ACRCSK_04570 [Fusobacteriaceae bacterium]
MSKDELKLEKILKLKDEKFELNLKSYSFLKKIIQLKLTSNQLGVALENLSLLKNDSIGHFEKQKSKLLKMSFPSFSEEKEIELKSYFEEYMTFNESFYGASLLIKLFTLKDYVLSVSKLYSEKIQLKETENILSNSYDIAGLNKAYAPRIAGNLLIKYAFILMQTEPDIIKDTWLECLRNDYEKIHENFIDPEVLLQIIFNESMSQSSKSSGGSSYENRIENYFIAKGINFKKHTKDSEYNAVEYDFLIELENGRKIGVSAKRTLRERYKQNHEDIGALEIDLFLVITLGTDLNEQKVKNILEKKGMRIFVSNDIYEKSNFLKNYQYVYSTDKLSNEFLKELEATKFRKNNKE